MAVSCSRRENHRPPYEVAIGHQQNLGLDLAESVDDPAHPEIGRGGGENGPDRRRGKERDDRFRDVWHPGGNPVSRTDADGAQPGREGSHLLPQFGPGDLSGRARLPVDRSERRLRPAPPCH